MALVGKAAPDAAAVLVTNPATKTKIKSLMVKGKPTVVAFVSKSLSPDETNSAVQAMEEGAFRVKEKAVFVIVSCDSIEAAKELHKEGSIRNCIHVFSATKGKEFGVNRTPAHFVIGADGKVKMQTEDVVAPYMSFVV